MAAKNDPVAGEKGIEEEEEKSLIKRKRTDDYGEYSSWIEESSPDEVQLSDSIFMFPKKKISEHGNVFEGEIRSGVYGIRPCVIKFAEISEQNVSEAKILSKLGSHTNIVAIVQSGTYSDILEDRFYIALDKCHKENLRQYLSNRRNKGNEFDLERVNDFARQIIDGVAYIHDNKVVHLDLKPSNILLSLNQCVIKIADFGLSRELNSTSSKLQIRGQFGTDGYRPVESFGNGWVSLRSDIFSLGAVLYHLLSNGEEVFGDDEHKYVYNVNNNVIDTSRLLVSNPKTTEHLIKLMLSNERCHRPTIWQVAEHPCWTGNEVECNFDYGCTEEIEVTDAQVTDSKKQPSDELETEAETHRKLVNALKRMKRQRTPAKKPLIIIFAGNSKHIQLFNPRNKTVTPSVHELHEKMVGENGFQYECSPVAIGDHIYVIMKDRSMYRLQYRDRSAKWKRMADLIDDHGYRPCAVVASGSIIIAGGSVTTTTKSVTKYDPSLNRWEKLKNKQLNTKFSAIAVSQGYVYCLGGRIDGIGATNRVERLDLVSQTWGEVASMQEARNEASAVECGEYLFVVGGWCRDYHDLSSVEKYNSAVNQWTIAKPMMKKRSLFRCHSFEHSIYVVGPYDLGIEKYDKKEDKWEVVPEGQKLNIYESVLVKFKN